MEFIKFMDVPHSYLWLSQVAAEIAAPLSQAKKITMVSDGSGEVGAARITGEVLDIMVKVPTMVNKMTGVDVTNVSRDHKISTKEQRQVTLGNKPW